jgi:hypothetical protein
VEVVEEFDYQAQNNLRDFHIVAAEEGLNDDGVHLVDLDQ